MTRRGGGFQLDPEYRVYREDYKGLEPGNLVAQNPWEQESGRSYWPSFAVMSRFGTGRASASLNVDA